MFSLGERGTNRLVGGASFSGHERDHVFLNQGGKDYLEVSGISGLDHPGDGRGFAVLDFDRDGWQDFGLVSANAPFFQLFRNQIGDVEGTRGGIVALRFEGGNREARPSDQWSARDGYGSRVLVKLGSRTLLREHRAGEGRGAQNSATMRVGIGKSDRADRVEVRWPSGKTWDTTAVPVGTLVIAYEDPSLSPTGAPFVLTRYLVSDEKRSRLAARRLHPQTGRTVDVRPGLPGQLILYTTMATWCVPCLEELPSLNLLRRTFSAEQLAIYGVPYDETETADTFRAWAKKNAPPYEILQRLSSSQISAVKKAALDELRVDGVPVAIVTDEKGNILLARWGPPSISEIRGLLKRTAGN